MISFLRGTVEGIADGYVVLGTGAIGYGISVTERTAAELRVGEPATLHTVLLPRDDSLTLYGFATPTERDIFNILRGTTGVGPKTALAALSGLSAEQIAQAVRDEDDRPFRSISGIGPKTAKLIVVQLAGKFPDLPTGVPRPAAATREPGALDTVVQALIGLGWKEREARDAAEQAVADGAGAAEGLRAALKILGTRA
ncbi:MAG: Holliday junction branch migration protein RuvA [Microbacteriaceae bacterium]|nr:Holliday junction branch migration protein RuvA [Microbacteriaceae bacterium]